MKIRTTFLPPARIFWGIAASPVGKLVIGLTDKNEICRISFLRGSKPSGVIAEWQGEWPRAKFSRGADVKDYSRKPVLLVGTAFQHAVWRAMLKIPKGRVAPYGEIARRIGNAKAVRAVGTACGANPVPYLVPCHRVVAANGLGGFSSGLEVKKALLRAEGCL